MTKIVLFFAALMALPLIAQAKAPACPRHKHLNAHHRCVADSNAPECPAGYYAVSVSLCCADGAVYVGHNRCEYQDVIGERPSPSGDDDGDSTTTPGTVCTGGECTCSNGTVTTPGSVCP